MAEQPLHRETLALHAGWRADPTTGAVAVPIQQTVSFQFKSAQHAADMFDLKVLDPHLYTRLGNPTTDVLEKRVAALEGGAAALAVSAGQAASTFALANVARAGDNVVSSANLYGGTYNLFAHTLRNLGIEVRFVNPDDPQAFVNATDERTRAYFSETLANPRLVVPPLDRIAAAGRDKGIPLIVDNTAAAWIARPFEQGVAVVVHSTTKYIGGHGTAIGGMIVDGGNFDWEAFPERQPLLNEPDPGYHGLVWARDTKPIGPVAYILRARAVLLRDLGSAPSPFNAFLTLQGLETLPLRMPRACENALKVVRFLEGRADVTKVIHPSVQSGDEAARAKRILTGGLGALVGFELAGGLEAGQRFIDALKLLYHVANMGDTRSLAIHPASTTHRQLTEEEQQAAGVTPGYVRLSIGIEHIDDILADLGQALDAARG